MFVAMSSSTPKGLSSYSRIILDFLFTVILLCLIYVKWKIQFTSLWVFNMKNTNQIVFSLTSIPPRYCNVGKTLKSIINQSSPPDRIELFIPRTFRRFSEHAFCVPEVPDGVEVRIVDHDYGPATKVLPAVKKYRGTNTRIFYGDDDRLFPPTWLKQMIACSNQRPKDCIVTMGMDFLDYSFPMIKHKSTLYPRAKLRPRGGIKNLRWNVPLWFFRTLYQLQYDIQKPNKFVVQSGYVDIAVGYGGVSIDANIFDNEVFNIPSILWAVDDEWLSGHMTRRGINIWADTVNWSTSDADPQTISPLHAAVLDGADHQTAALACVEYFREKYGIWK